MRDTTQPATERVRSRYLRTYVRTDVVANTRVIKRCADDDFVRFHPRSTYVVLRRYVVSTSYISIVVANDGRKTYYVLSTCVVGLMRAPAGAQRMRAGNYCYEERVVSVGQQ